MIRSLAQRVLGAVVVAALVAALCTALGLSLATSSSSTSISAAPAPAPVTVQATPALEKHTKKIAPNRSTGQQIADFAVSQEGVPYVWGGNGPNKKDKGGYDCSGLAKKAVKVATGKDLPRSSRAMAASKLGKSIPTSQAQPGDLVFFYQPVSHVGVYKGNGIVVHAPGRGQKVRETSMKYMPHPQVRRFV